MAELPISLDSIVKAPKVRPFPSKSPQRPSTDMLTGNQTMGIHRPRRLRRIRAD